MSCNSCKCKKQPCGCEDQGLTTPCPQPVDCNPSNPCSETFSSECVYYTGPTLVCDGQQSQTPLIPTNLPMASDVYKRQAYNCNGDIQGGLFYLRLNGAVTKTTVSLIWNSVDPTDTSYKVSMKLASDPVSAYSGVATVTSTMATISGLTAGTEYDFFVEGLVSGYQSVTIRVTTL